MGRLRKERETKGDCQFVLMRQALLLQQQPCQARLCELCALSAPLEGGSLVEQGTACVCADLGVGR